MGKVSKFAAVFEARRSLERDADPPPPPDDPLRDATPVVAQPPPLRNPAVAAAPPPATEQPRPPADPGRVTKGYTRVTNHMLDDILPTLDPAEQVALLRLYRLSRGHDSSRCRVSMAKLIGKTRVKRTKLRDALATLEALGYIRRLPDDVSNPDADARGMTFEMLLEGAEPGRVATPSAQRPRSPGGPNKEAFKQNTQKATDPEEVERVRAELAKEFPHLREGK